MSDNQLDDGGPASPADVQCRHPAPAITFPPLKDANGKTEPVLGVRFAVGRFIIEIRTDGACLYIENDDYAEMNAAELTALAAWAKSACKTMARHNGEDKAK